ncbi:Uncharacterised protein [Moraxella lacunata]|uniref:Uncharacterized protein n=2 Tax=Moraxella lacunata TaxID=477 RepID=A0A378TTT2_MORLA|nr:Uncharacterised protein [Moraxella lacunata]
MMALAMMSHADESYWYDIHSNIPQKTMNSYHIQCYSKDDIYLKIETLDSQHQPFNFCAQPVVNEILKTAHDIKSPNFAKDLKLIEYRPYNNKTYKMAVIIDEKDKKIIPSTFVYGHREYFLNNTKKPIKPTLKASKDSYMYCFSGDANVTTIDEMMAGSNRSKNHLCTVFLGEIDGYYDFLVLERGYYFGAKLPEQDKEISQMMTHRNAKELIKKANRKK